MCRHIQDLYYFPQDKHIEIQLQQACVFLMTLITLWGIFSPTTAQAENTPEYEFNQQAASKQIWNNGIGSGLRKGSMLAGFGAGSGVGIRKLGSLESHDLALAYGHVGRILTDVKGDNHWYSGNLELWGELFAGAQYDPDTCYVVGLTIGPRYHVITNSPWVPYAEFGAGVSGTDIRMPDLSSTFEFNVLAGAGTQYFFREDLALNLQIRLFHLSNAGIKLPNRGTNTILFYVGFSWLLE